MRFEALLLVVIAGVVQLPVALAVEECFLQASSVDGSWGKKLCYDTETGSFTVEANENPVPPVFEDVAQTWDMDTMYLILAGCLVFFMQTGFALLEAGAVSLKNMQNILFKNLMDASLGAIVWFLFGYAFAYGDDTDGPFIGSYRFALSPTDRSLYIDWFFQYTFAATAATIVSGSVAERCKIETYFVYAIVLTLWVYPVVVHWVWDGEGFLNVLGVVDFAGSSVVHLTGGCCGLVGAALLGPRFDTFDAEGSPIEKQRQPHKVLLQAVGTTILWFGWYGFNCGSTLGISGQSVTAARVAVATTLAAASGAVTTAILGKLLFEHYDLGAVFNGILTGLVAICACVATIEVYMAIPIGIIAGIFYILGARMLLALKIDDPLDAFPVHGFGGLWGILCPGIFSSPALLAEVYSDQHAANYESGKLFGIQFAALVCVAAWSSVNALLIFGLLKITFGIRVPDEIEKAGLDTHEHGGTLYDFSVRNPVLKSEVSQIFSKNRTPKHSHAGNKTPRAHAPKPGEENRSFIKDAVELTETSDV